MKLNIYLVISVILLICSIGALLYFYNNSSNSSNSSSNDDSISLNNIVIDHNTLIKNKHCFPECYRINDYRTHIGRHEAEYFYRKSLQINDNIRISNNSKQSEFNRLVADHELLKKKKRCFPKCYDIEDYKTNIGRNEAEDAYEKSKK